MRNQIDSKALVSFLENNYPFKVASIKKGPRGFVAETFIAVTDSDKKFFIKVTEKGGYTRYIEESLPALSELYQLGLKQVAVPIKSNNGSLSLEFNGHILIVFNFIEGKWSFECDFNQVVEILANLHKLTPKVKAKVGKEDYQLPLGEEYQKHFKLLQNHSSPNQYIGELVTIIKSRKKEFEKLWQIFLSASEHCQKANFDLVITHGDALCNTIDGTDGQVYLVDWDDILLAPAERDNWFLLGKKTTPKFLKAYQRYFPSYRPDKLAYEFYVLRRYFDDIEGFIKEILEHKEDKSKKQNLKELYDIFNWLDPVIDELDL